MPKIKSEDQEEKRWQMPHVPHGTLVTGTWSGSFTINPDPFWAQINQPAPPQRDRSPGTGGGEGGIPSTGL